MTTDSAARPPLDPPRVVGHQPGLMPDLTIEVADELGSTNEALAERARAGAPDGLVLVADHQSAGRGRLDRSWEAPRGTALTFSLLLRSSAPTRSWPWLPLLTGYAVDRALRGNGLDAGVKWPNDVLVGERKIAGILVERVETSEGPAAVIGVGVNVSQTPEELPGESATSIELEIGRTVDRTEVLLEVLTAIREAVDAWELGGDLNGIRLQESYAAACVTVGRRVRVDLPGGEVLEGEAVEIDPAGQLVVVTESGRRAVAAGDVVHVRAA